MSSINKLTSLSTQTLSLILERQRFPHAAATHDERIQGNMQALRDGIRELGSEPEVNGLRQQYERMRGMVGGQSLEDERELPPPPTPSKSQEQVYTPYTDDPDPDLEAGILLQEQRRLIDGMSSSLQRDVSLQINSELNTHTELLDGLDEDLDTTHSRLSTARRSLERVSQGVKGNGSTVTIGVLIFVLLVLIVIFKT
ncbi:uncharacterized protein EV420DRAFT_1622763 [Desarmillaria tabescens]|uniref:t-SNARE coiled-coil homology domain-containing protein n=1 Tax=Armillaria tabescens TaxID=1929756 RepID=A0AA39JKL4_ARMTA|nr:uncharacterized protein EV420DRAFT_1622763 [Desarmillaria tabescens]KAK0444209.1 hypothetical protein EV420DRAFT_1622763 [Desarmillaria tabescens]